MLTKLRYGAGEGNSESSSGETSGSSSGKMATHGLQIIGMSATMPNVAAVADWLQVSYFFNCSYFFSRTYVPNFMYLLFSNSNFIYLFKRCCTELICSRKNITKST